MFSTYIKKNIIYIADTVCTTVLLMEFEFSFSQLYLDLYTINYQ